MLQFTRDKVAAHRAGHQRRYIIGSGMSDWIHGLVHALSANKDTIKDVAGVVGKVAKAGASTASAVKQIVDVVKAKRAAAQTTKQPLPTQVEKALSGKSVELLKRLAAVPADNVTGAGFKTLQRR